MNVKLFTLFFKVFQIISIHHNIRERVQQFSYEWNKAPLVGCVVVCFLLFCCYLDPLCAV